MWGSEFTTKATALQRDSAQFVLRLNCVLSDLLRGSCCVMPPLSKVFDFLSTHNLGMATDPAKMWSLAARWRDEPRRSDARHFQSMPQLVCPRQGRRRPTPRLYAAKAVLDYALVAAYGHMTFFLPPAGPTEAPAEVYCQRRRRLGGGSSIHDTRSKGWSGKITSTAKSLFTEAILFIQSGCGSSHISKNMCWVCLKLRMHLTLLLSSSKYRL